MQIFSGSNSQQLASDLANIYKATLGQIELSEFANHEARIWVKDEKIDKKVVVVQSFAGDPNKAIIEFLLIMDALKRSGAKHITAIIPWMGYCIQDKIFRQGEPLSAKVVTNLIECSKPDKIITVDLHNETIQGFFSLPIVHLSATPVFIDIFKKHNQIECIVAPDRGSLKKTTLIAEALDLPIVFLNKKRDLVTGQVQIVSVDGDITGKKALIMDDFISTGGTLIQTAEYLKSKGAKSITAAITHHLYVEGVEEKLEHSQIDQLLITNTIEPPKPYKHKNIDQEIISIAPLISRHL
ncbi:ribose-phosphate pyrophosphokinase [Candidatus Beckwithbacteria bacterium]|nr:ribose-phosphate pyrophosphokinase [Candidatus Beckwithbacteria bacterium]